MLNYLLFKKKYLKFNPFYWLRKQLHQIICHSFNSSLPKTKVQIPLFQSQYLMDNKYVIATNTYLEVFGAINKKEQFQLTSEIYDILLPFKNADGVNITNAFDTIFKKLLDNQNYYGNKITILFVSSNRGDFCEMKHFPLINKAKNIFKMQFFCIAVGDQFPTEICLKLRKLIHNFGDPVPFIISTIPQLCDYDNMIKYYFEKAFLNIREIYLSFNALKVSVKNEKFEKHILAIESHVIFPEFQFQARKASQEMN